MECPSIDGITFNARSKEAINAIRRKKRVGKVMNPVIGAGTLVNIFAGNHPIEATYNLSSTDFRAMSQAMLAVPQITRNAIRQEAELAWYYSSNSKEKIFWNAVIRGCRLPL